MKKVALALGLVLLASSAQASVFHRHKKADKQAKVKKVKKEKK